MGAFNDGSNGFRSVGVKIPRLQLILWVDARIKFSSEWLEHKESTLARLMEDTKLTTQTIKSLLSGMGGGYGASNSAARGGVESHEQAKLVALVQRINQLKDGLRDLRNIRAGLLAAVDSDISVNLGMVATLQPGNPEGEDAGEEDES